MTEPLILFFHIERAGGTSVHRWLTRRLAGYYPLHSWYYWANEPEHGIPPEELARLVRLTPGFRGAGGHTLKPWMDYSRALGEPTFNITFLRDPRERFMSHFNFQRVVKRIPWTLEEFAGERRFQNYQTVRLAGSEDVETAFSILSRFDFVGFTESLDASLSLLSGALGWEHDRRAVPVENRIEKNALAYAALDPDQRALVEAANTVDQDLYERAVERWARSARSPTEAALSGSRGPRLAGPRRRYRDVRRRVWSLTVEAMVHRRSAVPVPRVGHSDAAAQRTLDR
jgi:hypothetical protein